MKRLALAALTVALLCPAVAHATTVGWGSNWTAQLGVGYQSPRPALTPETVLLPASCSSELAPGGGFALARCADGTVRSWGSGWGGGLCNGTKANSAVPRTIPGLRHVKQVAAGGQHSLILLENGEVLECGGFLYGDGNGYSARGSEGAIRYMLRPVAVKGLIAKRVFAGGASAGAILPNGHVVCWGEAAICGGHEALVPTELAGLAGATAVVIAGEASLGGHGLALMPDRTVKAWGSNQYGQDGLGALSINVTTPTTVPGLTGVAEVAAGPWSSFARTLAGDVMAWGQDGEDQLGVPPGPPLCGRGRKEPCSRTPVTVVRGATQVAAGYDGGYALAGGRVLAWGGNREGELGNGTRTAQATPVASLVTGVLSLTAGPHFVFANVIGPGPPPPIEATPGVGSLSVLWRASAGTEPWVISYRPVTKPQSKWTRAAKLPASARSYTLTGLASGTTYQLTVASRAFGTRGVTGVPR